MVPLVRTGIWINAVCESNIASDSIPNIREAKMKGGFDSTINQDIITSLYCHA